MVLCQLSVGGKCYARFLLCQPASVTVMTPLDFRYLQRQIDMLDDDRVDRVCEFLGFSSMDEEVDVDLSMYPHFMQVAVFELVSELVRESNSANGRIDNPAN